MSDQDHGHVRTSPDGDGMHLTATVDGTGTTVRLSRADVEHLRDALTHWLAPSRGGLIAGHSLAVLTAREAVLGRALGREKPAPAEPRSYDDLLTTSPRDWIAEGEAEALRQWEEAAESGEAETINQWWDV